MNNSPPPDEVSVPALPLVPAEYSGQWIAWNKSRTTVLARGLNVSEVRRAALASGEPMPLLQKVPRLDRAFVG